MVGYSKSSHPLECQTLLIECPASFMECHLSLMECHLSLVEFKIEEGLIMINHVCSSSRTSHGLLCECLTVGLVDGGRRCRIRANLLDHCEIPTLEAREDALDDLTELGGHLATQDLNQPLQTSEGHCRGMITRFFPTVLKCHSGNQFFHFIFEFRILGYQARPGLPGGRITFPTHQSNAVVHRKNFLPVRGDRAPHSRICRESQHKVGHLHVELNWISNCWKLIFLKCFKFSTRKNSRY